MFNLKVNAFETMEERGFFLPINSHRRFTRVNMTREESGEGDDEERG